MNAQPLQILVVEDNVDFLHTLCDMLAVLGHTPHGVASAEDASKLLSSERIHFHALIADIDLPGKSGIDLAKEALEVLPRLKIIFSSGFGYLLSDRLDFDFLVLHKPYFLHQLVDALGRGTWPSRQAAA